MKTVFTNQELPHVWIKETQAAGRANSMHFDGPVIYSYGDHFPVAKIYHNKRGKYVLFTSRNYSTTTAKHKSLTLRAIDCPYSTVYNVNLKPQFPRDVIQGHHDNLNRMLDLIEKNVVRAGRARVNGIYIVNEVDALIKEYTGYIDFFKPALLARHKKAYAAMKAGTFIDPSLMAKCAAAQELENKRAAQREQKAIAAEIEDLAAWRTGADLRRHFTATALRIKEDHIETSRGAKVPIERARDLARLIDKRLDVKGFEIDGHTVIEYDGSALKIGCHVIPQEEIDAIMPLLLTK